MPLLGRHTTRSNLRSLSTSLRTRKRTNRAVALLLADPDALVKTQRYCLPLSARAAPNDRLYEVAPTRLLQLPPPLVLDCHCAVGAGLPEALAERKITCPVSTVSVGCGCSVTAGAMAGTETVSKALLV